MVHRVTAGRSIPRPVLSCQAYRELPSDVRDRAPQCEYYVAWEDQDEDLSVRIVRLAPMWAVSAYGFGSSPEELAWLTLLDWAKAGGLLDVEPGPRFFGFNNPNPAPGSPNYGYEQWMTIGPEIAGRAGVTIKEFAGGLYAVTRCEGLQTITDTWHRLATWCEGSPMSWGSTNGWRNASIPTPAIWRTTASICTCRSRSRSDITTTLSFRPPHDMIRRDGRSLGTCSTIRTAVSLVHPR